MHVFGLVKFCQRGKDPGVGVIGGKKTSRGTINFYKVVTVNQHSFSHTSPVLLRGAAEPDTRPAHLLALTEGATEQGALSGAQADLELHVDLPADQAVGPGFLEPAEVDGGAVADDLTDQLDGVGTGVVGWRHALGRTGVEFGGELLGLVRIVLEEERVDDLGGRVHRGPPGDAPAHVVRHPQEVLERVREPSRPAVVGFGVDLRVVHHRQRLSVVASAEPFLDQVSLQSA